MPEGTTAPPRFASFHKAPGTTPASGDPIISGVRHVPMSPQQSQHDPVAPQIKPGKAALRAATAGLLLFGTPVPGMHAQGAPAALPEAPLPAQVARLASSPTLPPAPVGATSSSAEIASLPDAPQPAADKDQQSRPARQFGDPKPAAGTSPSQHLADKGATVIPYDWHAQPLTAHDKVRLGAQDLYSVDNFAAMVLTAGYSHVTNGLPNYGTDKGAFGERLGAAAIRESTQSIFTEMVFAPLLHEDPRYYAEGPHKNPIQRTLYAATRPLITRKDNGGTTVNGALLLGYAASAALTPAFYPSSNRNFHDTAATYGGSIGGAAIGFFLHEIANDAYYTIHLRRTP